VGCIQLGRTKFERILSQTGWDNDVSQIGVGYNVGCNVPTVRLEGLGVRAGCAEHQSD
jgi:hypothetical protein